MPKKVVNEVVDNRTLSKQELAAKIWDAANKLRGKVKAVEYKDYLLAFLFYKYLSDKEVDYLESQGGSVEDLKDVTEYVKDIIKDNVGYYISYNDLFSTWMTDPNFTAVKVSDALTHFQNNIGSSYKKVFTDIFKVLQVGLSKLGDNAGSLNKSIRSILAIIDEIPPTPDEYDVMGYIFEYVIQKFATMAKDDGAFYTPHEVSTLISKIVAENMKGKKEIAVYDPTCGSGSLLLTVGDESKKYIENDKITYYGQELITETYNLSRMNLIMKEIAPSNIFIRNGDTLADDWPYFDEVNSYEPLFVDACIANPPYSQLWDITNADKDERFRNYGIAPKGKADLAFLLHCLYHIKHDGIMGIVLPHGVLFRGGTEGGIRKNLIDRHNIETIIGLPSNLFYATGIPTIIMILKKERTSSDVLFIDASKEFEKDKKQNVLRPEHIEKIFKAVQERKDIDKFAHLATLEEIKENDYNLNIPRYVDTSDEEEKIDLSEVTREYVENKNQLDISLNNIADMMAELVCDDEDVAKQLEEMVKVLRG